MMLNNIDANIGIKNDTCNSKAIKNIVTIIEITVTI